jgi:hypothetical protein
MWSLGCGRLPSGGIPASSSPVLAGETAGEVHVVTRMRFGAGGKREQRRERAPRHQAAVVAASPHPARLGLGHDHTRVGTLEWRRGRRLGASVRNGNGRRRRLHGDAALAGSVGAAACVRRHDEQPFIAKRERCGSKPSS